MTIEQSASRTWGGQDEIKTRSLESYENSAKYDQPKIPGKIIDETNGGNSNYQQDQHP